MALIVDIIWQNNDYDAEGPSCSTEPNISPPDPPPTSKPLSKEDDGSQTKISMAADNQKLFEEFVDYCSRLTVPKVTPYLRNCFSKAEATYLSSEEFHNTVGRFLTQVKAKKAKVYVYVRKLCIELRNHSYKKKVDPKTRCGGMGEDVNANGEVLKRKVGSKRQIQRFENLLKLYSEEIQNLQEKELSLEDMEDENSAYIQESRMKKRFLNVFETLCELQGCSTLTDRVTEQHIQYEGTRYKEVNRRLEKFINKSVDTPPNYRDILQEFQKASKRHNLGLTSKKIRDESKKAFRELGTKLQGQRHLDLVHNFGCHLTDSYKRGDDPAKHDPSLAQRLHENRCLAKSRLDDVYKKYAEMKGLAITSRGVKEGEEKGDKSAESRGHIGDGPIPGEEVTAGREEGGDNAERDLPLDCLPHFMSAKRSLEEIFRKYAEMQNEGKEEDGEKRDPELPSTPSHAMGSQRSSKTRSPELDEDELEESNDEESEESDVDVEEELRLISEVVLSDDSDELDFEGKPSQIQEASDIGETESREAATGEEEDPTKNIGELGTHGRKRNISSGLWTENSKQQKLESAKFSSSSYPSSFESCRDKSMVTCSLQVTPNKTPSRLNMIEAATQCEPVEVIDLSD